MNRALRILLPLVVIALGASAAVAFIRMRPEAERTERKERPPLVETVVVRAQMLPPIVRAAGVVSAAREVTISPQVSGRVVWQSEELVPGGRLKAAALLVKLDARDYELAIEREKSRVEQASLELKLEQSRREIAKREWELLGQGKPAEEAPLALREPQLDNARRQLESARLAVAQAELNLERTQIRAPFDAMVTQERVELGQVVAPGAALATLVGTETFWATVSLPVDRLSLIALPGKDGSPGSVAKVVQSLGDGPPVVRQGRVLRIAGPLDAETRTAQLVVEIARPLEGEGIPLLPGAYVEVEIEGRASRPVYPLPRAALIDGGTVWLVDGEQRLARRRVAVAWGDDGRVYIREGLEEGERVVVSPLSLPVAGTRVEAKDRPAASATASAG